MTRPRCMATGLVLVGMACLHVSPAGAAPVWLKVCLHAHTRDTPAGLQDDGADSPAALVERLVRAGYQAGVHTPHSNFNRRRGSEGGAWLASQAAERGLSRERLLFALGEELTVAAGPRYRSSYRLFGRELGGNLDHLTLVGIDQYVPDRSTIEEGCAAAHAGGGFCVVNHPGPGPREWEEGYWEAPAHRTAIDGLEVYNGQAYAALGIEYEQRYLDATAYGGSLGGAKLAAIGSPDTHGAARVARLRAQVGKLRHLLGTTVPAIDPSGAELGAATMILADGPEPTWSAIERAVRDRRTVALFGFGRLDIDCPGLGEVRRTGDVSLHLDAGRTVAAITLYREGVPVRTWTHARAADFAERVTRPTAYVWGIVDGSSRAMTSGIWYEP